jgi:hypothetical protein
MPNISPINFLDGTIRLLLFNAKGIHLTANDWIIKSNNSIIGITNECAVKEGEPVNINIRKGDVIQSPLVYQTGTKLTIRTENQLQLIDSKIELINANGQKVISTFINQSENVDISSISTGIYFYKIVKGDARFSGKVFIQKD